MVEAAAASSVYAVIASWLTPSWLFIFVNLAIGTIAITSRFASTHPRTQQQRGDSPGQLARSASLLDRLVSFNLGRHKHYQQPAEERGFPVAAGDPVREKREPPRLARAPSLLDRVKSLNLGGLYKTEEQEDRSPDPDGPIRKELTRAPTLLERLVSMKLYRSKSIHEKQQEPGSGSEPESSGNGSGPGQLADEEEEGVDKKADDFIKRFKQQLRLQRLDSILRYRDMLKGN